MKPMTTRCRLASSLTSTRPFVSSRLLRTHGSHFVRRRPRWDFRTSWRLSSAYSTVGSDLTKEAFDDRLQRTPPR